MDVDYTIEKHGRAESKRQAVWYEWRIYSLDALPGNVLLQGRTDYRHEAVEEVRLALDNRPRWKLVITGE